MKRSLAIIIALSLCCASVGAFAAGKLNTVQENFYTIDSYGTYSFVYAKVENVGDKPIKVNAGLLEVFDAEGDPITSTDYIETYATYLAPGEYTYVSASTSIESGVETVDDYMLTLSGKSDNETKAIVLPCETSYEPDVSEGYWTSNYMYATFTNTTDEPIYDLVVVLALLDADGNILYMDDDSMYSTKALNPGGSITVRKDVDSSFIKYFEENSIEPTSVDAFAYVHVPNK